MSAYGEVYRLNANSIHKIRFIVLVFGDVEEGMTGDVLVKF